MNRYVILFFITLNILPSLVFCQKIEKILFDSGDSVNGYYLAIQPQSKQISGIIILLTSFTSPESILTETKLQNVAYVNNMLTIVVPMKQKLYADTFSVNRINLIVTDIINRNTIDTTKFVLAGYDESGNIALRYTELAYEHPSQFPIQPKAVFAIDSPVDLFEQWHWSEKQIKKNYWQGSVGDAKFYLDVMTKENGTIYSNPDKYKKLSPFNTASEEAGNEQYLKSVPVRLYYDTDIEWQLKNRRNSYYDTKMPAGSELIKRLLISGNNDAEFIVAPRPGYRSSGIRHPNALSIVDEVDCIQWIKRCLNIFDVNTWTPPYHLAIPENWTVERFPLPPDFAQQITYKGIEDLRFAPGWADSKSDEYWSYAYLWLLDGSVKIDILSLKENLKAYYDGLIARNITVRNIPANKIFRTTAIVNKTKTYAGDFETYTGEIHMLDYMNQQPVILNTIIHVNNCSIERHTVVFVEISPKPYGHSIWVKLNKLAGDIQCNK